MKKILLNISIIISLGLISCNSNKQGSESTNQQTTQPSQEKQANNLNPPDFKGKWSNEGDVAATSRLEIEINQIDTKIEGTITYEEWDEKGEPKLKSGLCSIDGTIEGETVQINLYSPKGALQAEGQLIKDGNNLKFVLTKDDNFFPKEFIVWKQ